MIAHYPDDPPPRWHNPVLALGNFDGLHRGHAKIIDRVRRRAGERGGTPAAMTFDPHPPRVVRPDKAPALLMTTEQRNELPENEEITAADRLIVESPTTTGLIVIKALAPEPSMLPMARNAVAGAQCRPSQ